MNLKVGDKVVVIAGSDKGKEGKIIKTIRCENRVVVEGVHMIKKHVKPNGQESGWILEVEAPIHVSNVKVLDKKETKKEAKKEEKNVAKKTTKKASKKKDEESK